MALKLGEMLIKQGLLSEVQLAQALQAQSQFGGKLGTNLVEMGFITEEQLARTLSDQLNIPYVATASVAGIDPKVIAKVPKDIAAKYRAVPFKEEGRSLCVCMADPYNLQNVDELGFRLGLQVKPFVIAELALNYALELYYGVRRDVRFLKLSGDAPSEMGIVRMSEQDAGAIGRGEFLNTDPLADRVLEMGTPPIDPQTLELPVSEKLALGPFDWVKAMPTINNKHQVISFLCDFLQNRFEHLVILAPQLGRMVGVMGRKLTSDVDVTTIQFPIVENSLFHRLLQNAQIVHRDTVDDQSVASVCATCKIPLTNITIMPVFDNRQVLCFAICQGVSASDLKQLASPIRDFLGDLSCAFQIVSLQQQILSRARQRNS